MATMTDLVDRARVLLQDPDKVRWSDADLLVYANEALGIARSIRPDMFFGTYTNPVALLVGGDTFPLRLVLEGYFVDYIVARAHFREIEFTTDPRAEKFYALFRMNLATA